MSGRAYRNKGHRDAVRQTWMAETIGAAVGTERPDPNAPLSERAAWALANLPQDQQRGLGPEHLDIRMCAMPECEQRAVSRSLFCGPHHESALGEAGAKELRQLTREMERMGRITDKEAKAHAVRKFRSRVESGDFAILFSGKMQETLDKAAEDAQLGLELGALRVALARAIQEIEDPGEMSTMVSRIANASARTVRANAMVRRERGGG